MVGWAEPQAALSAAAPTMALLPQPLPQPEPLPPPLPQPKPPPPPPPLTCFPCDVADVAAASVASSPRPRVAAAAGETMELKSAARPAPPTRPGPHASSPRLSGLEELRLLHIFSGKKSRTDSYAKISKGIGRDRRRPVRVKELDFVNCRCCDKDEKFIEFCKEPECQNLLDDEVFERVLEECHNGQYHVVLAGIPCDSYSILRFRSVDGKDNGARPLRDRLHPLGLNNLEEHQRAALHDGNMLTARGLELCAAVHGENFGPVALRGGPRTAGTLLAGVLLGR